MDDKTLENELKALARKNNAQIYEINPREIMVREWVRWRCKFVARASQSISAVHHMSPALLKRETFLKNTPKLTLCTSGAYPEWETSTPKVYLKIGIRFSMG